MSLRAPVPDDRDDDLDAGESFFAEVNITPLTDVILVLLIIFMVSSSAMVDAARDGQFDVELPKAGAGVSNTPPQDALVISILRDGQIALDGTIADEASLASVLGERHEKNARLAVVIDADGDLAHRKVVHVIELVRKAGFREVGIGVSPDQP